MRIGRLTRKALVSLLIMVMVLGVCVPMTTLEVNAESKVTRIYGEDSYKTSFKVADVLKKFLGVSKFDSIILASGNNYPDAISGSSLAAMAKAPILRVRNGLFSDVVTYVNKNLKKGGTVYILGGTAAVSSKFNNAYDASLNANVVRLGGANRYETNIKILEEADRLYGLANKGKVDKTVIVCTGQYWADALTAGATGHPILLVNDKMYNVQKKYLEGRGKSTINIVGGTVAVNNTVATSLKNYGTVSRITGKNRFDTAVQIAKKYFGSKPSRIILAYGDNYADGLSAGPLAQTMKCPILLTSGKYNIATAYNYQVDAGKPDTTIIGGTGVISSKLAAASNLFKKGYNAFGSSYVYINNAGKIVTSSFKDTGYTVSPNAGGFIKKATYTEVKRRQELAALGDCIIIDISDQKLYYLESGVIRSHDTPKGTYYINSKIYAANGDFALVGDDYTSYVTYWMPFIGNSYGIHDATWRSSFGGSIYTYNGSHGCVNVPKGNMKTLYNMVPRWTKVIVRA